MSDKPAQEWFEKLSIEAILKKRQSHKSFVVDMTKKKSKCLFPVVTPRFVFGNIPADMEWAPEQIDIVKEAIDRRAQDVIKQAVENKKAGTFSRAAFLTVPRLTPEQKAAREVDAKKRKDAREAAKAIKEKSKKEAEAKRAKKAAEREVKRKEKAATEAVKLEAKKKAIEAKLAAAKKA